MGNTVFVLRDWGPIPPSPIGLRPPGIRMVLAPNLSGLRWYSQICPRQMHGIPPILSNPKGQISLIKIEKGHIWRGKQVPRAALAYIRQLKNLSNA